ncbi:2-succinyl-5-enolpyruvyl-6-hydroxy-3-cyclohexene-1-carboxylic-acid synthase [Arthrobacter sp. 7749]|nr:2-succinyl-5-enolpyruvyl-6-hydroxy-3-cyclohexene-1-carboxylic-acid synthase [Arthrobacter sp. 7749]
MPSNSVPELSSMEVARLFIAALQTHGVRDVVICPGSRSAPLAYALAEAEATGSIRLHVRIDERVAGFTALGLSEASRLPAAIVTTSGTAVGELLPAVMEANHSGVPLVVLSADRPEELHGTGANQTTNQINLFGHHVRSAENIHAGQDPVASIGRALSAARGTATVSAGPVQLNVAFRDPLIPGDHESLPQFGANIVSPPHPRPVASTVSWNTSGASLTQRTVVVAGHGADADAADFAQALGLPLFAEPSSNARFGSRAIGPYRTLLASHGARIQKVVLFGRPTLTRPVAKLLADPTIKTALWHPAPAPWFEAGRRREELIADAAALVAFAGRPPAGWLAAWQQLGTQAAEIVAASIDGSGTLNGPVLAREIWATTRGNLVVGSSNIIRDADLCAEPAAFPTARVFANRGLAGIDGTVSTATGIAQASARQKTTVVLGDVTFLHDVGGLLLGAGEPEPEMDVVVLNDGGGAIFSTLEHGAIEASGRYVNTVERLFATPHQVGIQPLAAAYGWDYCVARTVEELRAILQERGTRRIIEVPVSRDGLRPMHAQISEQINALVWPEED